MKLSIKKELENNIYMVTFSIVETTEAEKELFHDFGELVIPIGGELKGEGETVIATLPLASRKFPSQFPISNRFADSQYENKGKEVASAWATTIQKRIEAELEKHRLKFDDFTGSEEVNI